jgi:hypothetical protein
MIVRTSISWYMHLDSCQTPISELRATISVYPDIGPDIGADFEDIRYRSSSDIGTCYIGVYPISGVLRYRYIYGYRSTRYRVHRGVRGLLAPYCDIQAANGARRRRRRRRRTPGKRKRRRRGGRRWRVGKRLVEHSVQFCQPLMLLAWSLILLLPSSTSLVPEEQTKPTMSVAEQNSWHFAGYHSFDLRYRSFYDIVTIIVHIRYRSFYLRNHRFCNIGYFNIEGQDSDYDIDGQYRDTIS